MGRRRLVVFSLLVILIAGRIAAQAPARRLTTLETLRQFPGYFNLQNVLLRGEFVEHDQHIVFRADDRDIDILPNDVKTTSGPVEVRAQLIDVGRLERDDPRLAHYDATRDTDRWPRPGEELLLNLAGVLPVQPATTPSVRALALEPWKFEGQTVTVVGQFRGRNLFGDLPSAPAKSNFDFVIRAADGAVWVTGRQPKNKGLDLDIDARADTGRWVQVTGTVTRERTMATIEATAITSAQPPSEPPPANEETLPVAPRVPGEVVFSTPTQQETDVPASTSVRLQFSRGLDPATVGGHIQAGYADAVGNADSIAFESSYDAASRSLELRFTKPLDHFRTFRVRLLDGLKTFDGADVTPWTLTFSLGD